MFARIKPHFRPYLVLGLGIILGGLAAVAEYLVHEPNATRSMRSDDPSAPTEQTTLVQPHERFSPADVVGLQLAALDFAREGERGIKQCFQFASPANRRSTGPVQLFALMLKSSQYDALLDRRAALVGRANIDGAFAQVLVSLIDIENRVRLFQFELSKQNSRPHLGCWMTDAVSEVFEATAHKKVGSSSTDGAAS